MIRNVNENIHDGKNNNALDQTNNTQHTNTNDRNENHETNTIENRTTRNNGIENAQDRIMKENKKNDDTSIVSIDDMDEEELQRYLEMATQLIPIEEEHPTEQPTVNNEMNVHSDNEASEESLSIGGSHGKEPGMIRISGFNPNGIKQQQLEAQIQHCIDSSIDVQCFSEINLDVYKTKVRTELVKTIKKMDK